jgi:hypothetical protein
VKGIQMNPKFVRMLSEVMPFVAIIVGIIGSIVLIFAHFRFLDYVFELMPYYNHSEPPILPSFPLVIISIMLGTRIGRAIYFSDWKGQVSEIGEITFISCLVGFYIYSVSAILIYRATGGGEVGAAGIMYGVLNFAAMIGVNWSIQQWHDKRVAKLEESKVKSTPEVHQ